MKLSEFWLGFKSSPTFYLLLDIVAGLVVRTTDMRMEEVAAAVDDRVVADVEVEEEGMVVMEAMAEVAEEEVEEDGEDHQVAKLLNARLILS